MGLLGSLLPAACAAGGYAAGGPTGAMVAYKAGPQLLGGGGQQTPPPAVETTNTPPPVTVAQSTVNYSGQSSSQAGYDPNKDFNRDGKITEADYVLEQQCSLVA